MWCYVHNVIGGAVYMWCCIQVLQLVRCTCDVVYTLSKKCCVQVVLCTCCIGAIDVHVVLCACRTCCVVYMRYYICAFCRGGIVTSVWIVLYFVYIDVLCCTPDAGVCVVVYVRCRCICFMSGVGACIIRYCMLCVVVCV